MKKILLGACVGIICVALCACKDKTNVNVSEEKDSTIKNNEPETIYIDNEILDLDYNYNMNSVCIVAGYENKIYSCAASSTKDPYVLYVADLETGEQKTVCNKTDCKHNNLKCNAVICDESARIIGVKLINNGIYFVVNMLGVDRIVKMPFDGSGKSDIGMIFDKKEYDLDSYGGETIQIDDEYAYELIRVFNSETQGKDEKNIIFRYKLDGTQKEEIILEMDITDGTQALEYKVYDGYLYYFNGVAKKRLDLETLESEEITDDMFFVSGFNDNAIILSCTTNSEKKDIYSYHKESGAKYYISDSGLNESDLKLLTDPLSSTESYIDDKYIYVYSYEMGKTYVFDLKFSYIDNVELYVLSTIGDNLICKEENNIISVKREEIFDDKLNMCTIVNEVRKRIYEWPENVKNN
ncbi:MAG: hypothetical protein E7266_04515 [Lachnospiraceae bacterium]|nr:hypothetical protein [Lachnospiraceae bacterium]